MVEENGLVGHAIAGRQVDFIAIPADRNEAIDQWRFRNNAFRNDGGDFFLKGPAMRGSLLPQGVGNFLPVNVETYSLHQTASLVSTSTIIG